MTHSSFVTLLAVSALLSCAACAPPNPVEQLKQARAAHQVELMALNTWERRAEPAAQGQGEKPAGHADSKTSPSVDVIPESSSPGESSQLGILAIRVKEEGSPLALECLTIDVVFEGGSEEAPVELGRQRVELDIEGIADVGGTLEISQRFDLPPGTQSVTFDLADVPDDKLMGLCEAKAVAPPAP